MAKITNKRRREFTEFADKHKFIIHPGKGFEYYITSYEKFQCCPCDDTRDYCPCDEAVAEVKKEGSCKCRLFWRDYKAFADKMLPLPKLPEDV